MFCCIVFVFNDCNHLNSPDIVLEELWIDSLFPADEKTDMMIKELSHERIQEYVTPE